MRFSIPALVFLFSAAQASWVCPVRQAERIDSEHVVEREAPVALESFDVTITPVPIDDEVIQGFADWDYLIVEKLVLNMEGYTGDLAVCIDLGVVPEECREVISVFAGGAELAPCSSLAGPFYPSIMTDIENLEYILRHDHYYDEVQMYMIEDMQAYRERFEGEDEFRSAVPQTARIYTFLYSLGSETIDLEVTYVARGWTYISGGIPLRYSLLQPSLWLGAVPEISLKLDLSQITDREDWQIKYDGELFAGETQLEFVLQDFDPVHLDDIPVLEVTPAGLSEF